MFLDPIPYTFCVQKYIKKMKADWFKMVQILSPKRKVRGKNT